MRKCGTRIFLFGRISCSIKGTVWFLLQLLVYLHMISRWKTYRHISKKQCFEKNSPRKKNNISSNFLVWNFLENPSFLQNFGILCSDCLCDKACQFLALYDIFWQSHLEKLVLRRRKILAVSFFYKSVEVHNSASDTYSCLLYIKEMCSWNHAIII